MVARSAPYTPLSLSRFRSVGLLGAVSSRLCVYVSICVCVPVVFFSFFFSLFLCFICFISLSSVSRASQVTSVSTRVVNDVLDTSPPRLVPVPASRLFAPALPERRARSPESVCRPLRLRSAHTHRCHACELSPRRYRPQRRCRRAAETEAEVKAGPIAEDSADTETGRTPKCILRYRNRYG